MLSSSSQIEARAVTYPLQSGNIAVYDARRRVGTGIKINPGRVAEIVTDRAVMRHELTHLLTPENPDTLPTWMGEGIAEYVAHLPRTVARDRADVYAQDIDLTERRRELVDSETWGYDPPGDYLIARASTEYLVQREGLDRFLELMDNVAAAAKPDTDAATDRALRRVYDISSAAVAKAAFAELD